MAGELLNAIKKGEADKVRALLSGEEQSEIKLRGSLDYAASFGQTECLKLIVEFAGGWGTFKSSSVAIALRHAADAGHVECTRILSEKSSEYHISSSLCDAAHNGHTQCVEILFGQSSYASKRRALRLAASAGHRECVLFLAPKIGSGPDADYALVACSHQGLTDCVNMLVTLADPKKKNSYAIQMAAQKKQHECIRILAPLSNVDEAI